MRDVASLGCDTGSPLSSLVSLSTTHTDEGWKRDTFCRRRRPLGASEGAFRVLLPMRGIGDDGVSILVYGRPCLPHSHPRKVT